MWTELIVGFRNFANAPKSGAACSDHRMRNCDTMNMCRMTHAWREFKLADCVEVTGHVRFYASVRSYRRIGHSAPTYLSSLQRIFTQICQNYKSSVV